MNEESQAVDMTIEMAEAKIATMQEWETLLKNPLFDKLITKDYLGDDAVRLTINLKPTGENDIINNMLAAKAVFSRFIGEKLHTGVEAIQALEEHKELQAELRLEERD